MRSAPRIARRRGSHAELASAIGNRAFCALIAREDKTKAVAKKGPKLDYDEAERQNRVYAVPATESAIRGLGWEGKLAGVARGPRRAVEGRASYSDFADAVAALQVKQGAKGKAVDGMPRRRAWSKLAGPR